MNSKIMKDETLIQFKKGSAFKPDWLFTGGQPYTGYDDEVWYTAELNSVQLIAVGARLDFDGPTFLPVMGNEFEHPELTEMLKSMLVTYLRTKGYAAA